MEQPEDILGHITPDDIGQEDDTVSTAILEFLKSSVRHFPKRFSHHTAFKDPSIALANLTEDERRKMKAQLLLMQIFEMASRYRFELDNDYMFFQDFVNEEVYFTKNLSLGSGKLLEMLKSSLKIVDVGKNISGKNEEKKRRLFWR